MVTFAYCSVVIYCILWVQQMIEKQEDNELEIEKVTSRE
jgi:hypothetical protein